MPYETPTPRSSHACSVHIISSAPNRGRQAKDDERQRTVTYASRGGCACALERAAGIEPSDRHVAHTIGTCYVRLRLARSKSLERFLPLMRSQLAGAPKTHPTGLRTLPSLPCTSKDQ